MPITPRNEETSETIENAVVRQLAENVWKPFSGTTPADTLQAAQNETSESDSMRQRGYTVSPSLAYRIRILPKPEQNELGTEAARQIDAQFDALENAISTEQAADQIELSIVMPCLNEADTVGTCVRKAFAAIRAMGISAEVIVADNGSTDGSIPIAESLGARVVHVREKGYGAALQEGIAAARGKYVLMGDSDDSYDFGEAPRFLERLRAGADLVQGCRLPTGGGRVLPGAMPWLHHLGNPALTWLVRQMFGAKIHDVYCGMRGFTKSWFLHLRQTCTGMEFATEMIIKSQLFGAKIEEIPITLHPDGRKAHRPHLRTFRDGWRTVRFFMLLSPRWTFLYPAALLFLCGLLGAFLALSRTALLGIAWDAHTLLVSVFSVIVAVQLASFALLAKTYAIQNGILPEDARLKQMCSWFSIERALWAAGAAVLAGLSVVTWKSYSWMSQGFGPLDYSETMRWIIPATGSIVVGMQVGFCGLLFGLMRFVKK